MQTINKWTLAIVVLCWVAGAKAQRSFASVYGHQKLNFTSHTDDYIIENKRQYVNNIENMEARLNAYRGTYKAQVDTVQKLKKLMEVKYRDVMKRLVPLELLGDLSKHCVQKYKKELPTIDSVKPNITNCVIRGYTAYNGIVLEAENLQKNLSSWYNNELNSLLYDCKNKPTIANSYLNYTLCVIQAISTADAVSTTNMKAFDLVLQKSVCTGDNLVSEATDCTFDIIYSTTKKIGEVTRLIENCTQGKELCPPCQESGKPDVCPNEVKVSLKPDYYRNATIVNPFRGLNTTHNCVQVNFDSDANVLV